MHPAVSLLTIMRRKSKIKSLKSFFSASKFSPSNHSSLKPSLKLNYEHSVFCVGSEQQTKCLECSFNLLASSLIIDCIRNTTNINLQASLYMQPSQPTEIWIYKSFPFA